MAAAHKATILTAVNTALSGILVASGYKTTVVTVEQAIKDWDQVSSTMRPWVGYMPMVSRFEPQSYESIWTVMPLIVGAHVHGTTAALADAAIIDLQDDIIKALYSDPTFGETGVDVKILTEDDDIGDPDKAIGGTESGFSGTFSQNWEVTYERSTQGT